MIPLQGLDQEARAIGRRRLGVHMALRLLAHLRIGALESRVDLLLGARRVDGCQRFDIPPITRTMVDQNLFHRRQFFAMSATPLEPVVHF